MIDGSPHSPPRPRLQTHEPFAKGGRRSSGGPGAPGPPLGSNKRAHDRSGLGLASSRAVSWPTGPLPGLGPPSERRPHWPGLGHPSHRAVRRTASSMHNLGGTRSTTVDIQGRISSGVGRLNEDSPTSPPQPRLRPLEPLKPKVRGPDLQPVGQVGSQGGGVPTALGPSVLPERPRRLSPGAGSGRTGRVSGGGGAFRRPWGPRAAAEFRGPPRGPRAS